MDDSKKKTGGAAARLGLLGCLAAAVWIAVCGKGVYSVVAAPRDLLGALGRSRVEGSSAAVVESVRKTAKLNVLRVVDAGLKTDRAYDDRGLEKAVVEYQYAGQADIFVDLSRIRVSERGDGGYEVHLPGLEVSAPLEVPLRSVGDLGLSSGSCARGEYVEVSHRRGGGDYEGVLLQTLPARKAAAVREACRSPEHAAAARARAEYCLRHMLSALVRDPERELTFVWERDFVSRRD